MISSNYYYSFIKFTSKMRFQRFKDRQEEQKQATALRSTKTLCNELLRLALNCKKPDTQPTAILTRFDELANLAQSSSLPAQFITTYQKCLGELKNSYQTTQMILASTTPMTGTQQIPEPKLQRLEQQIFNNRIILTNNHGALGNPAPRLLIEAFKQGASLWKAVLEHGASIDIGSCDARITTNPDTIQFSPYGGFEKGKTWLPFLGSKPTTIHMSDILRSHCPTATGETSSHTNN